MNEAPASNFPVVNPQKPRDYALDNYRGFVILLLIFFFSFDALNATPAFFLHAQDGGILTFSDFIAPGFMLALVFAFTIGLEKFTANKDYKGALRKFSGRYLALVGIGYVFIAFSNLVDGGTSFQFNVFTTFGISGLCSLFFITFNKWGKLFAGCALLVVYQLLLFVPELHDYAFVNDAGGLLGCIAWCGFMLVAMFLAQLYRSDFKKFSRCVLVFLLVAFVFSLADILMKTTGNEFDFLMAIPRRASLSFMIIMLGFHAGVFWLFAKLTKHKPLAVFTWYGRNSLLMYFVAAGIGNIATTICNSFVTQANIWYVMPLSFIVCITVATTFAYVLHRFKIIVTV